MLQNKKCKICNIDFITNVGIKKYCSKECGIKARIIRDHNNNSDMSKRDRKNELWRNFYRNQKGYEPVQEINCVICNNKFLRKRILQKYCSNNECRLKYQANKALEKYYKQKDKIMLRRKNDINYFITNKLRMRIRDAVKSKGQKKLDKTMNLLGCSIEEFKQHIESQFKEHMSWENYDRYGWHIDHIKPCCKFNLEIEEEQRKCFHYTNLQPMWARENLQKSGKYDSTN